MNSSFWTAFIAVSVIGAVVGLSIRLLLPRILTWRGVWFSWHTRFGPALVFDSTDQDGTPVRLLNVNGTFQSVCYVRKDLLWDPVCEYHRTWALVVHTAWPLRRKGGATNEPERSRHALVMGGGGFSFPKWLVAYRPDFCCEAVEIDPAITQIARERFFLDELQQEFDTSHTGRLVLATDDAWAYLLKSDHPFDLIINDAFRGNRPLGAMKTEEGAKAVHDRLAAGGIYIGNVRCPLQGRKAQALYDTAQAFGKEFAQVWVLPERPEDPTKPGNNALVASDKDLSLATIGSVWRVGKEPNPWQTTY